MASSLKALLRLQHGPLHGRGGHGIFVGLIIPHTQWPRACVDLDQNLGIRIESRGWPSIGLPEIRDATQPQTQLQGCSPDPQKTGCQRGCPFLHLTLSQNPFATTLHSHWPYDETEASGLDKEIGNRAGVGLGLAQVHPAQTDNTRSRTQVTCLPSRGVSCLFQDCKSWLP